MKTILSLIVALIFFASCQKCAECTRTWKVHQYEWNADHSVQLNIFYGDGETETFEVCGSKEIKNEERTIKTTEENGNTVTEKTGECKCTSIK